MGFQKTSESVYNARVRLCIKDYYLIHHFTNHDLPISINGIIITNK